MSVALHECDCLTAMRHFGIKAHAAVTDPPYELGFMGKKWDSTGIAFQPETWRLVLDALPPGGHLVAFGGTRTFHRMAVAIEDAGFELRDTLMWLYGTGFPKSHNQPGGLGTALKPAVEPIILARKPLAGTVQMNVLAHGTGALNIDGCRIQMADGEQNPSVTRRRGAINHLSDRPAAETEAEGRMASRQSPQAFRRYREGETIGRWPANVLHDGSDEVEATFAIFGERPGQQGRARTDGAAQNNAVLGALRHVTQNPKPRGDSGTASRFFYSAKASAADRAGSKHPTVKPVALMQWLVRLVCPPGGTVLDPFAGSGTTGAACIAEGLNAVLCENNAEYANDIRRRCGLFAPKSLEDMLA